jgi:predicted Holliday junction resolvase-like endonuclease
MFILKSKHDRLIAQARRDAMAESVKINAAIEKVREDTIRRLRKVVADLDDQIAKMTPDYELGQKRRANYDADSAKRRAARAAK